jgi:hypothetical protein
MEAAAVMFSGWKSQRDPAGDLVTGDDRGQYVPTISPAASAAGMTGAPGCREPAAWVSSKSSECASAPFRNAAPAGLYRAASPNTPELPAAIPMARTVDTNEAVLSASCRARTMLPTRSRTRKRARVTTSGGNAASLMLAQNSAS